jgi:ParB/RepB/Spo0J family partition protein
MSTTATTQFATPPLAAITPSLTNPRKTFDAAKLAELAESIKTSGVHQPILARPLPGSRLSDTDRSVTHEIIAGERRWRASQLAGVATIPAMIRDMTDAQVLECQLVENLQRDDLTALEEAHGYQALLATSDMTIDALAAKIGKSRTYVFGRFKLLDLCLEGCEALRSGEVDFSRALLLARIPDHKLQIDALKELTAKTYNGDANLSYRAAQAMIQRDYMLHLDRAKFKITDAALVPDAGSCRQCAKRTGHNPDLFADVAGADVCTDPPCYHRKDAAHTAALLATAQANGQTVIAGREAKELMPNGWGGVDGYLRLDDASDSPTDKPLRKLIGKQLEAAGIMPTLIANPHKDGELIAVLPKTQVAELLSAAHHGEAADKITAAQERSKKAEAEAAKAKAKTDYEQAWRTLLLERTWTSIQQAASESKGADTLSTKVLRHLAMHYANAANADRAKRLCQLLDLGKVAPKAALVDYIREAARPQDVLQLLIMQADVEYLAYMAENYPDRPQNAGLLLIADDYHVDIDAVKAECKTATRAAVAKAKKPTTPTADVPAAQAKGGGGPVPKLKRKTTAQEAQAQIAAALQEQEGSDQVDADASKSNEVDRAGAQAGAQPVAGADAPSLAVDVRVMVTEDYKRLPVRQHKWAGKTGVVTQKMGDRAWMVSFQGGLSSFDASELTPVTAAVSETNQARIPGKRKSTTPAILYRGPSGETWTGRGLMPRWLAVRVADGHTKESYKVPA